MPDEHVDSIIVDSPISGDDQMSLPNGTDKFHALMEQSMAAIGQVGQLAASDARFAAQAQTLDYLEGKRMVTLEEAIGVREVSSKNVPAGPTST